MQYTSHPMSNSQLITNLMKAMNGEYNAIHFYEQLAKLTPNEIVKHRILEIRKDEMRHYQGFSNIYTLLTGHQYSPQLSEPLPTNFKSGVDTAFKDEQEAVDFYHQAARESNIPYISEQYRLNAADEQNHAVWFLYFLNNI